MCGALYLAAPHLSVMRQKRKNVILRIVAWSIWLFFLILSITYIPGAKEALEQDQANIYTEEWFLFIAIVLGIVSVLEGSLTIALRHYALIKPAQKGTYNIQSVGGSIRFTIVNTINWFIAASLPAYGLVLYIMSGKIVFLYGFSLVGIILLIFHAPRLTPFMKTEQRA